MNDIPQNVAGWLASPKLDGVRCLFTGSAFVSRHGSIFTPPASWLAGMPACRHDSENERALVGARMANLRQGGDRKSDEIKSSMETLKPAITIERAAELSGSTYRPNGFLKVKRLFPDLNRSILD